MVNRILYLEYGSTVINIGSGPTADPHLRSIKVTQCTNSGVDLTMGSVCSACVEATVFDSSGRIRKDLVFRLVEVSDSGSVSRVGRFRIKTAARSGRHLYKITAFDNVAELDKDLFLWLLRFDWSQKCTVREFASKVCEECGLSFKSDAFPNEDVVLSTPVIDNNATGRSLMKWCAEIACRYCVADADGNICFKWYGTYKGHDIFATGDSFYYGDSFEFSSDYCRSVDAVVIRQLSDNTLWPETWSGATYSNPYIIEKNMFLIAYPDDAHRLGILQDIKSALDLTPNQQPFKLKCPADVGSKICAGDYLSISDLYGNGFGSIITNKVCEGQRVTLECTGNYRRRN